MAGALLMAALAVGCGGPLPEDLAEGATRMAVIGGQDDAVGRYTPVVLVGGGCSGTLIDRMTVVTAAHCLCYEYAPSPPVAGVDSRMDASQCLKQMPVTVSGPAGREQIQGTVYIQPSFRIDFGGGYIRSSTGDLAVIKLARQALIADRAIRASTTAPAVGMDVTVAGFGNDTCDTGFGTRRFGKNRLDLVTADKIELNNTDGTSGAITWMGDSGGALIVDVGGGEVLAGVTSYGACGARAGYTNVYTYRSWIANPAQGAPCVPQTERCDGLDNDCDGQIDEGLGTLTCGTGACARQVAACLSGIPQECEPLAPEMEVCDGADNDCDGEIDEDIEPARCGMGVCARTVIGCVNGEVPACTPGAAQVEKVDGLDNDCDGWVDEGFKYACDFESGRCGLRDNLAGACTSGDTGAGSRGSGMQFTPRGLACSALLRLPEPVCPGSTGLRLILDGKRHEAAFIGMAASVGLHAWPADEAAPRASWALDIDDRIGAGSYHRLLGQIAKTGQISYTVDGANARHATGAPADCVDVITIDAGATVTIDNIQLLPY